MILMKANGIIWDEAVNEFIGIIHKNIDEVQSGCRVNSMNFVDSFELRGRLQLSRDAEMYSRQRWYKLDVN